MSNKNRWIFMDPSEPLSIRLPFTSFNRRQCFFVELFKWGNFLGTPGMLKISLTGIS